VLLQGVILPSVILPYVILLNVMVPLDKYPSFNVNVMNAFPLKGILFSCIKPSVKCLLQRIVLLSVILPFVIMLNVKAPLDKYPSFECKCDECLYTERHFI
jgi:hypothetical protein